MELKELPNSSRSVGEKDAAQDEAKSSYKQQGPSSGTLYQEHALSLMDLQERLGIHLDEAGLDKSPGLTREEALLRLEQYGGNTLTPFKTKSEWRRLLEKFADPFMILLELASLLSFVLYGIPPRSMSSLYVALVLAVIIFLTCIMSYLQEGQTVKLMSTFASMMSPTAQVVRDGTTQRIPANDLVVGDIVLLQSGEKVPADVRVLQSEGLKVDNSSFTGESLPVEMGTEPTDEHHALHSHNMAFDSALVVEGQGMGVVVRTGDHTMIGNIAQLASQTTEKKSTVEVEVLHFVRFITFLAIATGILFYVVAVARGGNPLNMFITCFVVIVLANVPEGLPATVTSCLTVSARRLAMRHVFVKRLGVIETLGSTSVVATDKTGTLTQNKMTVSHVWLDGRLRPASYLHHHIRWRSDPTFLEFLSAASLCNMAKYEETANVLVPIPRSIQVDEERLYRRSRRGLARTATHRHDISPVHGLSCGCVPILQPTLHHQQHRPPGEVKIPSDAGDGDDGPAVSPSNLSEEDEKDAEPQRSSEPPPPPKLTALLARSFSTGQGSKSWQRIPRRQSSQTSGGCTATPDTQTQGVLASGGDASALIASYADWGAHTRVALHALEVPARKVAGNPSDVAIFNFCHSLVDVEALRNAREQMYEIPFNSRNKWMMSVNRVGRSFVAYLKGAPEVVVARCSHVLKMGGKEQPLDDDSSTGAFMTRFHEVYEEVARKGERVLALAMRRLDDADWRGAKRETFAAREEELPREGYMFLGLLSLVDPAKPGVGEAVLRCKEAGVKVIMITGDHPLTAEAVAREVNIIDDYQTREEIAREQGRPDATEVPDEHVGAAVVLCQRLAGYDDAAWSSLLAKPELVFARATPQDKLTIVEKLKEMTEAIVAVTGDGVNDSPALKRADVGIAMGVMGSEVAKNAANVILMDDNFCSIVNGIEEGRVLFDNLTKTIAYTLSHAMPELVAVVINIVFRVPFGLTSLMILSIDLLTEICPSVSFAWEPAESSVMRRLPRVIKTDRLVRPSLLFYSYMQAGLVESIGCLAAYLLVFIHNDIPLSALPRFGERQGVTIMSSSGRQVAYDEQLRLAAMAATAYYVTLILTQGLHVFAVKTRLVSIREHGAFSNPTMNFGVLVAIGIMCIIVYVPGISGVFGSYPSLAGTFFTLPALVSGTLLIVWSEIRKAVLRRMMHRPTALFARVFAW